MTQVAPTDPSLDCRRPTGTTSPVTSTMSPSPSPEPCCPMSAPSSRSASCSSPCPWPTPIARRYAGRGIETDDLVQVARTALVKAVHRYRPDAGSGFMAFMTPTVSGELKRWFRDHGWSVRPPRRVQELRAQLRTEEERMRSLLSRDPRDGELAAVLGVTVRDLDEVRLASGNYRPLSLDAVHALGHVSPGPPRGAARPDRGRGPPGCPSPGRVAPVGTTAAHPPASLRRPAHPGGDRSTARGEPDAGVPTAPNDRRPAAAGPRGGGRVRSPRCRAQEARTPGSRSRGTDPSWAIPTGRRPVRAHAGSARDRLSRRRCPTAALILPAVRCGS